jgi:hypothetical protein
MRPYELEELGSPAFRFISNIHHHKWTQEKRKLSRLISDYKELITIISDLSIPQSLSPQPVRNTTLVIRLNSVGQIQLAPTYPGRGIISLQFSDLLN